MASFDLLRISESLQSPKTKPRNDALALLDGLAVPKLHCTSQQLATLVSSLLKAIEIERDACIKTLANASLTRAANASGILKELVLEAVKKPSTLKERPKLKMCLSLMNSIFSLYYMSLSLELQKFEPCAGNLIQTLCALLEAPFIFTHLTTDAWLKAYHFLLRAIAYELEYLGPRGINENLVTNLYTALYTLVGGSLVHGIMPLFKENAYFPLSRLLTKTLSYFNKRESPVLVTAFKILNGLLISFSTEDAGFLHQLIRAGMNSVILFATTSVENLLEQLFIFLNLDSLYRYLSLAKIPKLISAQPMDGSPDTYLEEDVAITTYNLEMLIYALINRLMSPTLTLTPEDVGLCDCAYILDWYHLRQIYLRSDNSIQWLLVSAVSRLVSLYYTIRTSLILLLTLLLQNPEPHNDIGGSLALRSFSENSFKRQKLHDRQMNLNSSHCPAQFYNSLISEDDQRIQKCGLQLLAFHYELQEPSASINEEERNLVSNEGTVVDEDLHTSLPPYTTSIIPNALKLIADRKHTFWALLVCHVLLPKFDFEVGLETQILTRRIYQILKLLLDLIKDRSVCQIACSLFSTVLNSQPSSSLKFVIDNTLMNQLENVAELSELLGPASIDKYAVMFWRALARIFVDLGSNKRSCLHKDIAKWIIEKWNGASEKMTVEQLKEASSSIPEMITWFSGLEESFGWKCVVKESPDPMFQSMKDCEVLQKFIALEEENQKNKPHFETETLKLEYSPLVIDSIFDSITKVLNFCPTEEKMNYAFSLSMAFAKICEGVRKSAPESSLFIEEKLRDIFLSLTPLIRLKSQAKTLLDYLLEFEPNEDILGDAAFPFEIIDYHIGFLYNNLVPEALPSDLDSDFSDDDEKLQSPRVESRDNRFDEKFTYFKFLAKYENSKPDACIKYMNFISPQFITKFLSYYMDSELLKNHQTNPVVISGLVRLIGEKLLSVLDFDRSESTISISCRLLVTLLPLLNTNVVGEFQKDILDLFSFFFQCVEKDLLLSELARINVWKLLLCFTEFNDETFVSNSEILSAFLKHFPLFSNRMKITVSDSLHDHISRMETFQQGLILEKITETFVSPQSSVEGCATFCLFLARVTSGLYLDVSVVNCVIKYSRFPFFTTYLKKCILSMAKGQGLDNSRAYFTELKLDILKYWWVNGFEFSYFPYSIFGYSSQEDFLSENSREITAVLFSTRCKKEMNSARLSYLKTITEVKSIDSKSLVRDSLPLIISMSYTSNSIRSEVFASLKTMLGSLYNEYIVETLPLTVLEVIKLTDVKSEISLRTAIKEVYPSRFLQSSELIRSFNQETIDAPSSVELISALIKTFSAQGAEEFWFLETVYFLVRNIGLERSFGGVSKEKSVLRRLQHVMYLSRIGLRDFHLVKLMTDICLPMIKKGLIDETCCFMNVLDFDACLYAPINESLSMIFKILATIIYIEKDHSKKFEFIYEELERLLANGSGYFGTSKIIVECALNSARGQDFIISLIELDNFLADERNSELISQSFIDIFTIMSTLSKKISTGSKDNLQTGIASLCLKYLPTNKLDDEFRLWISEYLAEFHLSGLAYIHLEDIMLVKEYNGLNKMDFVGSYKTLNPFLCELVDKLDTATYEEAAFLENALGALIYKFKNKKRDATKFITFDECYESFSPHILPLDVNSYALLNPEFNECFDWDISVDEFVDDFENTMIKFSFEEWTCQLVLSLVQEISRYTSIAPVLSSCILKMPSLAKDVLPNLICVYLSISGERAMANIESFFQSYWKSFRSPFSQDSIELVKNIAISLRVGAMQNIDQFKQMYSVLDHKQLFFIVRESYLPKSALMFFEDSISGKLESLNWSEYRESLARLYGSLNDEDLLTGIPGDVTLENSLKLRHEFMPSSEKLRYSSGFLDADFILNEAPLSKTVIQSLLNEGYLGASNLLSKQSGANSLSEWSWKLNQWDIPIDSTSGDGHDVTYSFFKQVRENLVEMTDIYESSMLRISSAIPCTRESKMLPRDAIIETEKWLESLARIKSANTILNTNTTGFISEMKTFEEKTRWFEVAESQCFEDILLARRLAFALHYGGSFRNRSHGELLELSLELESYCHQGEVNEIVRYNNLLRKSNMLQKTINSSILLERLVKNIESYDSQNYKELQRLSAFQTAQTLWAEGKVDVSVALLRNLARKGDISHPLSILNVSGMTINAQLAVWLADSRLDLGSNIMTQVVDPMKIEIELVKDIRQRSNIYHLLGHFCELQFKSSILKEQLMQLETRVKAKKDEVQEIKSHYGKSEVLVSERNAARFYYEELKSLIKSETKELLTLKELKTNFAHNAVKFYLNALLTGESSDEDLDKFFSLFLELSGDEVLQSAIKSELLHLPSYKPLSWCTQILSRVSKEISNFQESIQRLIFKVCYDHPFHSLYFLTSLLFHEKLAKDTSNASMVSRVAAAAHIRNKLHGSSPVYAKTFLLPVERLCMECVSLAEVKSTKGRTLQLEKLKIGSFWLTELPAIPPPTLEIPVSSVGYKNAPVMEKIDSRISIASSGISLPKVVTVFLSDGKRHRMLLKHGTDDLRQDAIMEQVFDKVNKIFHEDKETRKRKLRVRTYSAIPLGPKAGAIEFVPDSKAFFEVIQPYHQSLDSMRLDKARELMKNCQTKELKERLKVYRTIEDNIKPVLEYYFLSNFVTPDAWFASRQIYIRGVATTSIVGHVLGLGDRHCNNILLDEFTGEPIHIDLGVAFDQGKRLKVPETVPFRLTRDIIDGFGYMGTAGSFTKVSEHTFRVLRASKDHILAILDVLRWDPLYSWSISPIRKKKLQEENTDVLDPEAKQDGSAAAKAILGVSDKLSAGGLSVEAAVRELIREASSEQNLAAIYCGWCPFY